MKKLIISETISIVLVLGIFLLAFTLLNGWEKTDQERYVATIIAVFLATLIAFIVAIGIVAISDGAACPFATVAAIVAACPFATVAAIVAAIVAAVVTTVVIFVVVAVVAATTDVGAVGATVGVVGVVALGGAVVVGVILAGSNDENIKKINASKKVIWLSLGVEAAAIILPIILITFC